MHGDFELDNIRFTDDAVAVFDFDEVRPGWAADDIALATRALRGDEGGHPDDPEWQRELHDELRAANAWHRRAVLDASAVLET
jgi:Ser/Thr protein kinase RdoA (MazF antagonist)